MLRLVCLGGLFLSSIGIVGCGSSGPRTAPVSGKISYKGKGLTNGTINFIPNSAGPSATGEIKPDGSYKLTTTTPNDGAILGSHKVVIVAMQDMKDRMPEDRSPLPPPIVPAKYTSMATTDLTADVKDAPNVIDFELKGDLK